MTYRVGRKNFRVIYRMVNSTPQDDDPMVGVMDSELLARLVVDALNHSIKMAALVTEPKP